MSSQDGRPVKRRRVQSDQREPQSAFRRFSQFSATPDTPIIVGSYIRIAFHLVGLSMISYVVFRTVQSFSTEIQARYHYELNELAAKARLCHQNYVNHNCGPQIKGAVWQKFCEDWNRCRNYQPQSVGKIKIAAQVFGELLNGFVEPLTFKAMLSIGLLLFGFFIVSSFLAV